MQKGHILKRIMAFLLVIILCMENQSLVNAAEIVRQTGNEEEQGKDETALEEVIDAETGLKMQTMVLEEASTEEEVPFNMQSHLEIGDKNSTQLMVEEQSSRSLQIIGNEYIEFAVSDETYYYDAGRFTIGTVEGNPNYSSDNNKILMFGHPSPSTSFTTVQINGVNYLFKAEETTFDTENKRAVSVMNVAGVRVIQTLEIVTNESSNLKDTVRINYSVINKGASSKRIGIRVMLDTMLGDNDGAPFKVPSVGSITKEREFEKNDVPEYWQAFDNLSNPSVFAVGTIHKNNQIRKPDKVQFASWGDIYGTQWDYEINSKRTVTYDSAVAFYWNPVNVAAGGSTSVETYYGTGLSDNGGQDTTPVEVNLEDRYVVLVSVNDGKDVLKGAKVTIEGIGSAYTDENGNAIFEKNLPHKKYPSRKKITISCDGYQTKEVYRLVSKSLCSAAILKADDGKPYIKSVSLTGISGSDFADYVDLTSQNYAIEEDTKDADNYYSIMITATGNGKGNINRYKFIQDNQVIAQETVTTDSRTIWLRKNKLKEGKRIYVQVETDQGAVSEKVQTTLLVNKNFDILGEDTKETKGNVKLGGSGVKLKIPEDAVAFGGLELDMELPGFPIDFEVFDDGTVKVSIGSENLGESWEEKEEEWDELISKYEKGDDLHSVFNDYEGSTSWDVVGKFKPSVIAIGYAEGKIDDFGNCNVDLMMIIGAKGESSHTRQYIVGYVPLGFQFKTGVKGTYTAGGTVTIGENSMGKLTVDFQGNKGELDVDIYASLYGGLGLVGVLTVGGEGEAHLLLGYDIEQQYYDAKVKGSLALTAKAFMFSAKYTIAERTWTIKSGYITESGTKSKSMYDVLYDEGSYTMMSRNYLSAQPQRQAVAASTEDFLQNVYPAAQPQMVLVQQTPYMFWLADDVFRDESNRTSLVYSKYENGWTDPVAVENDGTADFSFDVVSDGNCIHVIWQDMSEIFGGNEWERKSDEEKLRTMSENSDLSYACINATDGSITVVDVVKNNEQADMLPQITVHKGQVYGLWYTNSENNVLTQEGKNIISLAAIQYENVTDIVANEETEKKEEEDKEESSESAADELEENGESEKESEADKTEEESSENGSDASGSDESEEESSESAADETEEKGESEEESEADETEEENNENGSDASGSDGSEEESSESAADETEENGESEKESEADKTEEESSENGSDGSQEESSDSENDESGSDGNEEENSETEDSSKTAKVEVTKTSEFIAVNKEVNVTKKIVLSESNSEIAEAEENSSEEENKTDSKETEENRTDSEETEAEENSTDSKETEAEENSTDSEETEENRTDSKEAEAEESRTEIDESNTQSQDDTEKKESDSVSANSILSAQKAATWKGNIVTVGEWENTPIVSLDLGKLNGKLTVAYILDDDKNLSTIEDHDLYVYDAASRKNLFATADDICDAKPQFAPDGSALYWYADKQIYYIINNAADSKKTAAIPESGAIISDNYRVLNDNSIIWTTATVSAMDVIQYEIYKSEKTSGTHSAPYKFVTGNENNLGDITACVSNGDTYVAYVINYLLQDAADIGFEKISSVTDLTLENVEIDYTSVQPGTATDFTVDVCNNGSTDITQIVVNIYNYNTGEQTSFTKAVSIAKGTSASVGMSHTFLTADVNGVQPVLFTVSAQGETEGRDGDNAQFKEVGYTDVAVKSSTYYSGESYYSNVVVQNLTGVPAENVVLRVRADETDGAVLYEKYLGTLEAYKTYAMQLDLFSIAGNSGVDELHMVLSTDTQDYIENNNEEMEYLHFLWREEESQPLTLRIMKGDTLYREEILGNYYEGDVIEIETERMQGYDFVGWSAPEGGYFYDSIGMSTYFSMPAKETVIFANYIPNAFRELERTIVTGESLLITPVYAGVWQNTEHNGIAKIKQEGNSIKVTGIADGTIQLKYVGNQGEEEQIVTVNICSLDRIEIVSDYWKDGTLQLRPGDIETLQAQGIRQDGSVIALSNVTWSVKDSKTASLEGEVLTGNKKGKTTVEGRAGACKLSVPVEVYIPVASIYLSNTKGNSYLPVGKTMKLKAEVYGYQGEKPNNSKVTWSSSDTSIAVVSSNGTVTAKGVGNVEIMAEAADGSGICGYYYLNVTGRVTKITLSKQNLRLYGYAGVTGNISNFFNVYSTGGSVGKNAVQWKSSNPKVVSVLYGSTIRMNKKGTVTLTGSYDGKSVKVKVEVREYVNGVTISGKNNLTVGQTLQLKASPTNSTAYNKQINWNITEAYNMYGNSVSAYKVATISSTGKITGRGKGYVYVKATAADEQGRYATKRITVSAPIKTIQWNTEVPKTETIEVGDYLYIKAVVTDKDGATVPAEIDYKSSNTKTAGLYYKSTTGYNTLYAAKSGTVKVTASYGGKSISRSIKIVQPVENIEIVGENAVMAGTTMTYKVNYAPSSANVKKADWIITKAYDADGNVTEASKIATLSNGKLKAVSEGKVVIRASAKDGYGAYAVKTIDIAPKAGSLKLPISKLTMDIGSSYELTAELTDLQGSELKAQYAGWKSSNAKIVSVENGHLVAHKKGNATITVSYGNKKATVKVTVIQPAESISIIGNATITAGKTMTLKAAVMPKDVSSKKVAWEIAAAYDVFENKIEDTSKIATINANGSFKAISSGTVSVRAVALDGSGVKGEKKIVIYGKPDSMEITGKQQLNVGESTLLTAIVFDEAGDSIEDAKVKWSCSNSKIAQIDAYGKVTAKKAGTVTITAKHGNKSVKFDILVK